MRQDLGGKGFNVSRALRALGIPSPIIGLISGWTGIVAVPHEEPFHGDTSAVKD